MILSFTAINKQAEFRDFWCQLPELEVALDVLNSISLKGDTIIKAHIIDKDICTELPTEVFDGESYSNSINQLEKQWQAILREQVQVAMPVSDTNWYIDLTRQRIKIYDDRIGQFMLVVSRFEQLRDRAELVLQYEPQRSNLINHYNSSLKTYRGYIDLAKAGQQEAQEKLVTLQV